MEENQIKYSHARIVPTVLVLVFSFMIFGFILGYTCGYSAGERNNYIPPNTIIIPPNRDKDFDKYLIPIPPPLPSGNITL